MSETTITSQAPETDDSADRAYWSRDYSRFAAVVREARTAGDTETADMLAALFASTFKADSAGFDTERFIASTYPIPRYVGILARALNAGLHAKGQPWQPASDVKVGVVASLASAAGDLLAGVIPGFSAETFKASVHPPVPQAPETGDEYAGGYDETDDSDTADL